MGCARGNQAGLNDQVRRTISPPARPGKPCGTLQTGTRKKRVKPACWWVQSPGTNHRLCPS